MPFYYLLWIVGAALQVGCIVHAIKSGKSHYWFWVILFFPMVGSLVYFFMEVMPGLRGNATFTDTGNALARRLNPTGELRRLEGNLDLCDSQANRLALAQEYLQLEKYDQAIALYERCLTGHYRDDPAALLGLGEALYLKGDHSEARKILQRLLELHPDYRAAETRLFHARLLENLNENEAARKEYELLLPAYPGQEARYRFALHLAKQGETEQAVTQFQQVLRMAERAPRYYRKANREWIALANKELAALQKSTKQRG